jgi:hypothetical protein
MTIPLGPLRAFPSSAITARAEPFWAARGVGRDRLSVVALGASTESREAMVRIAATRSSGWVVFAKEVKVLAARDH